MLTRSWLIVVAALVLLALWGCAEDGCMLEVCDDGSVPDPILGCDDGDDTVGGILPTLASIQENIFTPICATSGCHNGTPGNPMRLDTEEESYANLVETSLVFYCGVPRVDPGNPDGSCIVLAIEGANGWFGNSPSMPPPPAGLNQEQIDAIREWIQQGALR